MQQVITTLFLLSLLSAGLDGHGHKGKLFHRYAKMKIMKQCYGVDLMKEWHDWISGRVAECQATRATRSADDSHELDSMEDLHASILSAEQLAMIKKKKEKKMRMLNCVLDAMNMTTKADGSVDTGFIVTYIKNSKIDADLKNDLVSRVEQCGKVKMDKSCRPSSSAAAADPAFAAKMAFMKCEMRARLEACVVRDLNKNKDMFKLGALDDMFSGRHYDHDDDVYDDDDDDDDV